MYITIEVTLRGQTFKYQGDKSGAMRFIAAIEEWERKAHDNHRVQPQGNGLRLADQL